MGKKCLNFGLAVLFSISFGCGQELPFEYQYKSANVVQIKYNNVVYELDPTTGAISNMPMGSWLWPSCSMSELTSRFVDVPMSVHVPPSMEA